MSFVKASKARRSVVVNLHSGNAVRGVLWQDRHGVVVLKGATLLSPGAEPVEVDGEVLIDRFNIDFVQVLGG